WCTAMVTWESLGKECGTPYALGKECGTPYAIVIYDLMTTLNH
ncbi:hypothetical protein Tco_0562898, partial [Tanacetum coccineum]